MLASHLTRGLVLAGRPRLVGSRRGVGFVCGTGNRRSNCSPAVSAFAGEPRRERQGARTWSTCASFGGRSLFTNHPSPQTRQTRDVTTTAKKKSKKQGTDDDADVASSDDDAFDEDFDAFAEDELMQLDENGEAVADGDALIDSDDEIYTAGTDWGETALASLKLVLKDEEFDDGLAIFSFKVSEERRRIYISIDAVRDKFGSPTLDALSSVSRKFNAELEEKGFPDDVALEVASPGAERKLRLPEDIPRFADLTMRVTYVDPDGDEPQTKVLMITDIDETEGVATWKLADVEENRPQAKKGQGMNKKQREWRLTAPFSAVQKANLCVGF